MSGPIRISKLLKNIDKTSVCIIVGLVMGCLIVEHIKQDTLDFYKPISTCTI